MAAATTAKVRVHPTRGRRRAKGRAAVCLALGDGLCCPPADPCPPGARCSAMVNYARSDTHFLLPLHRRLVNDVIALGSCPPPRSPHGLRCATHVYCTAQGMPSLLATPCTLPEPRRVERLVKRCIALTQRRFTPPTFSDRDMWLRLVRACHALASRERGTHPRTRRINHHPLRCHRYMCRRACCDHDGKAGYSRLRRRPHGAVHVTVGHATAMQQQAGTQCRRARCTCSSTNLESRAWRARCGRGTQRLPLRRAAPHVRVRLRLACACISATRSCLRPAGDTTYVASVVLAEAPACCWCAATD